MYVDCKTVGFFLKISSPVSLSVFSLVPDLLFDCSRLLEYARLNLGLYNDVLPHIFLLKCNGRHFKREVFFKPAPFS